MKYKNGFTTIEILVVIAVIAALVAGIILAVQRARIQSQNSEIKKVASELAGTQQTIKSEQNIYGGYESGSFEYSSLQNISDEITDINGIGLESEALLEGESEGWGMVTPTVGKNAIFCFSSEEDAVRRLSEDYDSTFDYTQEIKANNWECPDNGFVADANPESLNNITTAYGRLGQERESQVFDPDGYNKEIEITPQNGGEICKDITGCSILSQWKNSITVSPDSSADNFKLRNTTPSSPGDKSYDLVIQEKNGDASHTKQWTLEASYASCKEAQSAGYSTTASDYVINPDGGSSFRVVCDMNTGGGGWTLIASYVNGDYFYDECTEVNMQYGNTCESSCDEFADSSSSQGESCDESSEKNIQDSEMERLSKKYIIDSSEASGYRDVTQYQSQDYVSKAYHRLPFEEVMFADDTGDFITYNFNDSANYQKGSPGNTNSMKDFYETLPAPLHMETIVEFTNSNMNPNTINECGNFDLVLNAADNDGLVDSLGTYSGGRNPDYANRYIEWSAAYAGPQWDSSRNHGCRYDDLKGWWGRRYLGSESGTSQNKSNYILWYVK